jgi:hypothetical protein
MPKVPRYTSFPASNRYIDLFLFILQHPILLCILFCIYFLFT